MSLASTRRLIYGKQNRIQKPGNRTSEMSFAKTLGSGVGGDGEENGDPLHVRRAGYRANVSIVDVFREQAAGHPEVIAVKDASAQLTYRELDQQSDQICAWLTHRDLAAETLVAVLAPRSCLTIAAFLGVLKANLAYLPLDVNAPSGRIETILTAVQGHKLVLLGQDVDAWHLENGLDIETIQIAEILDEPNRVMKAIRKEPTADSLAYVMFTSGSTGQPKGVMIEHRGIVCLARQPEITTQLQASNRVSHIANIAFDVSTWEIYTAILNGGTLVCIDFLTVLDPHKLNMQFQAKNIRVALFTPAILEQYLLQTPTMFHSIEILLSAGDRLHRHVAQTALACTRGGVFNAYGPTESTVLSTWCRLSFNDLHAEVVPIGRAIRGSGAMVMDAKHRPVPDGVMGELVVTGDGLARGYLDSDQNRDRFINITIGGHTMRAYRTGDYARCRPTDGLLEFFGRMDSQVKIRGQRVELGEVEHVLLGSDLVSDAAVIVQDEGTVNAKLVGFITLRTDQNLNCDGERTLAESGDAVNRLYSFLRVRLPSYMVPAVIKVLPRMPLNANKKVDRQALAHITEIPTATKHPSKVAPRSDLEHALCEEFASILEVQVGITDNFFDLGGHSLLATRLVPRINRRLACNISVFDFYRLPTPLDLCTLILPKAESSTETHLPSYMYHRSAPQSKATIILIHGIWGQGNIFLPLVALLDHYFDILLIHDPFFGKPEGPRSITDWAEFYLNDIEKVIKQDIPVVLGGYSIGGLIAFEMVSLWRSMLGSDPASLLLLDAGSYPTLARFFSADHMLDETLNYALGVFGQNQENLITQHFTKLRSLSIDHVEQQRYDGDCLYLATPQARVDWWKARCPGRITKVLDCDHYDLLSQEMVYDVAAIINDHYGALFG